MELDIEAKIICLRDIFSYTQYVIPAYQRPYSWERKQTEMLLNDICDIIDDKSYFMATIMVRKASYFEDCNRERFFKSELIDGQQRLVTLLVLFRIIERVLASRDRPINQVLASPIELADNVIEQRILLNSPSSQSCLGAIILNGSSSPTKWNEETTAEARLIEMEKFFLDFARHKGTEQLERLSRVIETQLSFCVLTVKGAVESGTIFEGQNARGYPLTPLDLTKNWLIYIASKADDPQDLSDKIALINRAWETIFKELHRCRIGSSETESQYVKCIDRMAFSLSGDSYESLKKNVKFDNLESIVEIFEGCVKYFVALYRPNEAPDLFNDKEDNDEFHYYVTKLNNMGKMAEFLPLLCAAYYRFGRNANQVVLCCEKFAFRVYAVACKKKSTGEKDLLRLAQSIFYNKTDVYGCRSKIVANAKQFCPDKKFSSELCKKRSDWRYMKYLLIEYALHLEDDETFILSKKPNEFQVEHIASQESMNMTEAIPDELLHCIGNLSLTYDGRNQAYSNKPFAEKAARYRTSRLTIETQLATKTEWQQEDIEARTVEIANWAQARW